MTQSILSLAIPYRCLVLRAPRPTRPAGPSGWPKGHGVTLPTLAMESRWRRGIGTR
jgi:hypothetical protein